MAPPPPKRPPNMRPAPRASPLPGPGQTRSLLPAEIIAQILDYLPVPDLLRFARVSRRLQEMVYDDTRWVYRLRLMNVWNEAEARARFEAALRKRRESEAARRAEEEKAAAATGTRPASTLFDIAEEEKKRVAAAAMAQQRRATLAPNSLQGLNAGFDMMALRPTRRRIWEMDPAEAKDHALSIMKNVRSVRGFARQEYGRIYEALSPLYLDLVRARSHADPVVFRISSDPEEQAAMLALLKTFSYSDTSFGWRTRQEKLESMMDIFENAALREFEGGYESGDVDGQMRRYAHVLITLNGGNACIQLFVQKHPILYGSERLGNPMDCFDHPTVGSFSLEPSKEFFRRLSGVLNEQADVVDRVFPPTVNVMLPFLDRVAEDVITEYVTPVLDEAHERDIEQYLKAVTGLYQQCIGFGQSLKATKGAGTTWQDDVAKVIGRVFEAHVDLYLQDELEHFREKCEREVEEWEKKISDEDAATESFFMSNINREADKRDFLSSFKKVILMPVSIIPSPFSKDNAARSAPSTPALGEAPANNRASVLSVENGTAGAHEKRLSTASNLTVSSAGGGGANGGRSSPGLPAGADPPTTELAAKAAIMNTRLEGIRSLFSLEVALNLVHTAKESLERAAVFTKLGGQTGEEAREQCEAIFIALLQVLGPRHVQSGFDKAVTHLSSYDPRSIVSHNGDAGVAPLVTFLELVNVGDLIQQMVEVFYEQELVATSLTDRNDFINPAAKEKKRFESMLDERVAAGLNRGIDVLIDEVEHLFATTQVGTDFNPGALDAAASAAGGEEPGAEGGGGSAGSGAQALALDVSPTPTALQIVSVVSSHTSLLTGSTDKNLLDVFNTEVGIRLFGSICKHIKRSRISVSGAPRLISDIAHYYGYIDSLKLRQLTPYFNALRELGSVFLIDGRDAKELAAVVADPGRFGGVWRAEEVLGFVERREDWYVIKSSVERAMFGFGCVVA